MVSRWNWWACKWAVLSSFQGLEDKRPQAWFSLLVPRWTARAFSRCWRWGTFPPPRSTRSPRLPRGCFGCRWQTGTPTVWPSNSNTCPRSGTGPQALEVGFCFWSRVAVVAFSKSVLLMFCFYSCEYFIFYWLKPCQIGTRWKGADKNGYLLSSVFNYTFKSCQVKLQSEFIWWFKWFDDMVIVIM